MKKLKLSLLLLVLLGAGLACADSAGTPASEPTSPPPQVKLNREGTIFGFFTSPPEPTFEGVMDHFKDLGANADFVLIQPAVPWQDFVDGEAGESQARTDLENQMTLAEQNGLGAIFVVDPLNGLNRREFMGLPEDWEASFANPQVRSAFRNFTLWIVHTFHPQYIGLASEINTYADAHPDDFTNYLSLYNETYALVKAAAPKTQVFVTFQWEDLNNLFPGDNNEGRKPFQTNWDQVEIFEPNLDLWAISSYPYVSFKRGADIPEDYYTPLLDRTGKPLAVAEGGYTSRPVSAFQGTPQDQIDYLSAIHDQIGSRLDFWVYLLLSDFDPEAYNQLMREQGIAERDIETLGIFQAVGLKNFNGTPKPALETWQSFREASTKTENGERLLEIDITTPENEDYDQAIELAKQAGAQAVSLSVFWDEIETGPGEFNPDPNWLEVADQYYPAQGMRVSLTISVIDTTEKRLPPDLMAKPFDDLEVIERFQRLLDYVFSQIPDLDLVAFSIGNEVDVYLGTSARKWAQYQAFYEAAAAYTRQSQPGLPIGVKTTFEGMTGEARDPIQKINAKTDVIMVTYYPLNGDFTVRDPGVVSRDFDSLAGLYPGRPIYFMETGYPSSEVCKSSEDKQAEFVQEVFKAWDAHAEQIPFLSFTWLSDLPGSAVKEFEAYYGVSNKAFGEYLRSLGLRTYPGGGEDKPAWRVLKEEAAARGW